MQPIAVVLTAAAAFAATNIDDLVILAVLFMAARVAGMPRVHDIVAGQYLGFVVLVGLSAAGAAGLAGAGVSHEWVRLLGLVPIALGVRALLVGNPRSNGPAAITASGSLQVAALTVAGGGDNLSVYVPLFHSAPLPATLLTVAVFLCMLAVWCAAAALASARAAVVASVLAGATWLAPAAYIAIGGATLVGTSAIERFV